MTLIVEEIFSVSTILTLGPYLTAAGAPGPRLFTLPFRRRAGVFAGALLLPRPAPSVTGAICFSDSMVLQRPHRSLRSTGLPQQKLKLACLNRNSVYIY